MTRRRRRRYARYRTGDIRRDKKNYSYLVFFLSLVVLIETLWLLFLIPKGVTSKKDFAQTKKEVKIQPRKVIAPKTYAVTGTKESQKKKLVKIILPLKKPKKILDKEQKGKIAIVVDDWGYSTKNFKLLSEIKSPLTVAVLPFHEFSRRAALFAHRHNFEIIIHMPMEPKENDRLDLEPKTLMIDMDHSTLSSIMKDAFSDIPYAKGMNNHMGSLATEDQEFMIKVFNQLKKKDFYFLDSYVVSNSICEGVAKKVGIKFAKRSIFLDNSSDSDYIKNQLMELARESEKEGYAIGIGHDREVTLEVIKEMMPELEQQGYVFVFASELTQ